MITLTSLLSIKDTCEEKPINRYLIGHRWQLDTERASDCPLFQSKQSPCICKLTCLAISLLQWAPAWCQCWSLRCLIRISAVIVLNGAWEFTFWFPSDAQAIWSLAMHSEDFIVTLNMITWSKEMIPSFLEASSLLHSWIRLLIISKVKDDPG